MIKDVEKKHNIFKKKPKKHIFLVTSWRYTLIGEGSSPIGYEGFVQPRKGGEARLNQMWHRFPTDDFDDIPCFLCSNKIYDHPNLPIRNGYGSKLGTPIIGWWILN